MWYFIEKLGWFRIRNLGRLKAILTIYTLMQILGLKFKKNQVLYTSEKLRSWWIKNLRFWQILAPYTSMQNFRLIVKNTLTSSVILYWFRIRHLRWLKAILTIYTLMQIIRLKIKNSSVIHQWKAQVMVNQKFKILTNFGTIYFHAKF